MINQVKNILITACFAFVSVVLMSSSCEEKAEDIAEMEGGVKAVVTDKYASDGCAVLLEVKVDGEELLLYPVDLAEEFKENGAILMIKYRPSRIQQTDCLKGQPALIDEVVRIK